jgi:hypothetical protein
MTNWKHTTEAKPSTYKPLKDFNEQVGRAKKRGVGFEMRFGEWLWYWLDSGKYEQRGAKAGQYQMARRGPDIGPYKRGNVDIKLREDNLAEADYSQAWPQERKDMMSDLYEGTTKKQDTKDAMSAAAKARVARGDTPPDRSRPFSANGVVYPSLTKAAQGCGISREAMYKRIKSQPNGYKYA